MADWGIRFTFCSSVNLKPLCDAGALLICERRWRIGARYFLKHTLTFDIAAASNFPAKMEETSPQDYITRYPLLKMPSFERCRRFVSAVASRVNLNKTARTDAATARHITDILSLSWPSDGFVGFDAFR